jgi:hypothetical protein
MRIVFLFFLLPMDRDKKNQKNQARPDASRLVGTGQANAHEQSLKNVNTFCLRTDSLKLLLRV